MAQSLNPNRFVSARVLRRVARAMLPFYHVIATNKAFAAQWSRAVVTTNSVELLRLFRIASPFARKPLPGTYRSGYTVNFEFKGPVNLYGSGTSLPPGTLKQLPEEARAHRAVARAILPLYKALVFNASFTQVLAKAIRRGDTQVVTLLVRGLVRTPQLRSVRIEESGVALAFKFAFSPYKYEHFLFHEAFE
ncbi:MULTISPECIES: hypothetical protein [Paenibacillus]|uniref:hypothetical protein n=1 Tax=Paenibacillus TaxID=44249 RepID=UPI0022B89DC5|nr:hypothetical protein [Paenibacillus caseinilyticus]MCZ8521895.1 hypothetical protein [Paenibacillus caseinilyticus]